jgi:hypothetical protein
MEHFRIEFEWARRGSNPLDHIRCLELQFFSFFLLTLVLLLPTLIYSVPGQLSCRGLGGCPKSTADKLVFDWASGGSNPPDGMGVSTSILFSFF